MSVTSWAAGRHREAHIDAVLARHTRPSSVVTSAAALAQHDLRGNVVVQCGRGVSRDARRKLVRGARS